MKTAYRIAFVLAYTTVVVLSLAPARTLPRVDLSDKVEHLIAYALLAVLGSRAFPSHPLVLACVLVVTGAAVELLQQTMAVGRQGDLLDAIANTLGVLAGVALTRWMSKRKPGRAA